MSTMYCWTDLEDDTTSVHNTSIIQEPTKPSNEYFPGEEIVAKLPKFGIWKGVIVETSDSKKDLETSMKKRQKQQAEEMTELNGTTKESVSQPECISKETKQKEVSQKGSSKKETKRKLSEVEKDKAEEKKRKQDEKKAKINASNKEVEDMLMQRRKYSAEKKVQKPEIGEICSPLISDSGPASLKHDGHSSAFNAIQRQDPEPSNVTCTYIPGQESPITLSRKENNPSLWSPYLQNYSFLRDIYSPSSAYTPLTSRSELEDYNQVLFKENENLRKENSQLRSELAKASGSEDFLTNICATPSKVHFLKKLASSLERSSHSHLQASKHDMGSYSSPQTPEPSTSKPNSHVQVSTDEMSSNPSSETQQPSTSVLRPCLQASSEGMRSPHPLTNASNKVMQSTPCLEGRDTSRTPWNDSLQFDTSSKTTLHSTGTSNKPTIFKPRPLRLSFNEPPVEVVGAVPGEVDVDESSESVSYPWEESVTSSGVKKIRLVVDYDVWITASQLSLATHRANNQPRKMLINMLDIFFTRETLARSSAKGTRVAHNNKMVAISRPLNAIVLGALKEYILKTFKKSNGEPCLTESVFNEVINNKCATARRALNPK